MIFIDSAVLVARHRPSDEHYRVAQRYWDHLMLSGEPCFTSNLVIAEAGTLIERMVGGRRAAEKIRSWYSSSGVSILRTDETMELLAADVMAKYADQQIGYVDCVSFVLMHHQGIKRVFTFDRHFAYAGFELWPPKGRKK